MGTPSLPELIIIFVLLVFVPLMLIGIIMHNRQKKVQLINEETGIVKDVPVGYSWITLTAYVFLPIYRGDLKWFLFYLFSMIALPIIGSIIIAFFYNKLYIQYLIEKGYRPKDDFSKQLLVNNNIIAKNKEEV